MILKKVVFNLVLNFWLLETSKCFLTLIYPNQVDYLKTPKLTFALFRLIKLAFQEGEYFLGLTLVHFNQLFLELF